MPTTASVIRDTSTHTPFRRAYIKRRDTGTGLYESTWFEVTEFVENWGQIESSIDDVALNKFVASGVTVAFNNKQGKFSSEREFSSYWYGSMPRYRSLLKIEAGYAYRGVEYPTDSTVGIFIVDGDIGKDMRTNREIFSCRSIISPLIDTRASEIGGITTGSLTSSEIITKIRDATDGSGGLLFRNFITSTAWDIQSTTTIWTQLNTTTVVDDFTVWELMVKLAEAEAFVLYATRTGGIAFTDRTPNTSTVQHQLFGGKFPRPNVIELNNPREARDKLFTHLRVKYLDEDTETSYVTNGDPVLVSGSNAAWTFGRQTYDIDNTFLGTQGAFAVLGILGDLSQLKIECEVETKFMPQVEVLDHIGFSYRENDLHTSENRLWAGDGASGGEVWASVSSTAEFDGLSWDDESATTVEWWDKSFKVLKRKHDLENMKTTLILREV